MVSINTKFAYLFCMSGELGRTKQWGKNKS